MNEHDHLEKASAIVKERKQQNQVHGQRAGNEPDLIEGSSLVLSLQRSPWLVRGWAFSTPVLLGCDGPSGPRTQSGALGESGSPPHTCQTSSLF